MKDPACPFWPLRCVVCKETCIKAGSLEGVEGPICQPCMDKLKGTKS